VVMVWSIFGLLVADFLRLVPWPLSALWLSHLCGWLACFYLENEG